MDSDSNQVKEAVNENPNKAGTSERWVLGNYAQLSAWKKHCLRVITSAL